MRRDVFVCSARVGAANKHSVPRIALSNQLSQESRQLAGITPGQGPVSEQLHRPPTQSTNVGQRQVNHVGIRKPAQQTPQKPFASGSADAHLYRAARAIVQGEVQTQQAQVKRAKSERQDVAFPRAN